MAGGEGRRGALMQKGQKGSESYSLALSGERVFLTKIYSKVYRKYITLRIKKRQNPSAR